MPDISDTPPARPTARASGPASCSALAQRLRIMVEQLPTGAVYIQADGKLLVNPAAAAILGFDHHEVPTLDDWFPRSFGANAAEMRALCDADRAAGFPRARELQMCGPHGATRIVEVAAHAPDPSGEAGEVWLLRDLTETREAELALRESEARFRLLIDSVLDHALVMLSPDGHVRLWNAGAERLTGFLASEVIGRHVELFYPAGAKDEVRRIMSVAAREGRCGAAGWRLRRSGEKYWASVVYTVLRDTDGGTLGFAVVLRDLTERRAAELDRERLLRAEQSARAEADRANQAKSRFLTVMSTEFRTPLNTIRGFTELLSMGLHGDLSREQQAVVARIQRAEHQLARLVTDLTDYVRLESGMVEIEPASIEVATLLQDLVDEHESALAARRLSYDVSTPAALTLWADRTRLDQILGHLMESAIRCTPKGGHVFVGATDRGTSVALTVQDGGPPVTDGLRAALVEPFGRDHSSAPDEGAESGRDDDGSGLGLALSRTLALAMGGNLFVEEAEAGGARFVLLLPRAAGEG